MFYKVVIRRQGRLTSSNALSGVFSVEYWPQEWVEPVLRGSKLFVFDSLQTANGWADMWGSGFNYTAQVWSCECLEPEVCKAIWPADFARELWLGTLEAGKGYAGKICGAYHASAVKLLERVR